MVQTIAQQCPSAGGVAVIIARNLVEQFNENIEYDDDAVCLENGIYKLGNQNSNYQEVQRVKVIPNPSSKMVEVVLKNKEEGICKIEILNQLGSVVLKVNLTCKAINHYINVELIPSGVYEVKVMLNDSYFQTEKLIISR